MEGIAETQKEDFRIVLVGRTGFGKSSTGNTILGENIFTTSNKASSETSTCKSETRDRNNCRITLIDQPGIFDNKQNEQKIKEEILRCMIQCAPGPHAFLIVLRVGRFTQQEQDVIKMLNDFFGEEALRYSMIVFTYGDELKAYETINDYVEENEDLREFVSKCGGGCHVIDNKYWNNSQDNYRNNKVQVDNIIRSIEDMVRRNGGDCYTNEMLRKIEKILESIIQPIKKDGALACQTTFPKNMRDPARQTKEILNKVLETAVVMFAQLSLNILIKKFFGR